MTLQSLGRALYEGLRETAPYVLSHHTAENQHRCYRVGGGSALRLCARCVGIYLAIPLGIAVAVHGFYAQYHLLAVAVFPVFALLDWSYTTFTQRAGSNPIRTVTGALLGLAYGVGLVRVATSFPDVPVLLVGCGYATTAGLLLHVAHR